MATAQSAQEIKNETRVYLLVFTGLLFLSMVTVAASYLQLNMATAITLALVIAAVKASLVAAYFMHLIAEQKLIYILLAFAGIFFLSVLLLPCLQNADILRGATHVP